MSVAPLSARREIKEGSLRLDLKEFLSTPISLSPEEQPVQRRYPKTARTYVPEPRPVTARRADDLYAAQRRAFDVSHQKKVRMAEQSAKRRWEEEERIRNWRKERDYRRRVPTQKPSKDRGILEAVVRERNDRFLASNTTDPLPSRAKVSSHRPLPPEIILNSQASNRTQF